ncbi:hypothetical protein YC2023_035106 [Brassica napus]
MLKWACPKHLRPSPFNFCVHIKPVYLTILNGLRRFFLPAPNYVVSGVNIPNLCLSSFFSFSVTCDLPPIEYNPDVRGFQPFNDNFRLCFYNTTPNAYTLALRIGNRAQESTLRWVWEANRGSSVKENPTLTLGEDGALN